MIRSANNKRKSDHCSLNIITIWDGLRMPKPERASVLLHAHVSCLVLILYFASDLIRRLITKLVLWSMKAAWIPLTKIGYFDINVNVKKNSLLEKQLDAQLMKKFPQFRGKLDLIFVFTIDCHCSLFWAKCIHFTPFYPIPYNFNF